MSIQDFANPLLRWSQDVFDSLRLPKFCRDTFEIINVGSIAEILPDPLDLQNRLRPLDLVWVGITGDLMRRYCQNAFCSLFQAIPGLKNNLTIHGVGIQSTEEGSQFIERLRERGLPLADYQKFDDAFLDRVGGGSMPVSGVYIASPPDMHSEHCRRWIEATKGQVPIYCEKPLVIPKEIDAMIGLNEAHPGVIVPVDFYSTAVALRYLLNSDPGAEILAKVGNPKVINGTILEKQQVEHARLGGKYGLLDIERSGGGIMLDCAIHLLLMASIYRSQGGTIAVPQSDFTASALQTYLTQSLIDSNLGEGSGVRVESLRETGGIFSMFDTESACAVNVQSAKGVKYDMTLLDVLTDRGYRLVINVGAESPEPPYLSITDPDNKTKMIAFDSKFREVGYGGTLYNMLAHMLIGQEANVSPSTSTMFNASTRAISHIANLNSISTSQFLEHDLGGLLQKSWELPLEIREAAPRWQS